MSVSAALLQVATLSSRWGLLLARLRMSVEIPITEANTPTAAKSKG